MESVFESPGYVGHTTGSRVGLKSPRPLTLHHTRVVQEAQFRGTTGNQRLSSETISRQDEGLGQEGSPWRPGKNQLMESPLATQDLHVSIPTPGQGVCLLSPTPIDSCLLPPVLGHSCLSPLLQASLEPSYTCVLDEGPVTRKRCQMGLFPVSPHGTLG